ncbi:MAG TPA: hypothetical protein DFK15_01940 [Butyricimonas sp.]|jgi:hypothetical protein|uniref:Uncharacterized protein n=2 Tax=Odoribacteraceae TaxID=1853231 RepID=A0A415QMI4_9BACT|nr:hypothetical protein DWZ68_05545 [Butyricimonas virosa]HAM85390.1 hypothetical protein [Butyricimonas sp.]HCH88031.1 hypothetical protein [Butyricimonas sp.]
MLAVLSTSAQTFRNKLFPSNEISGEEFKKQAINKIQSLQNYLEVLVKSDQNTSKTAKNAAVENAVRLFSDENRIVEVNSISRPKPRKLKVRQYLVRIAFLSEKVYDKVTIRFYDVFFISNFKKRPDGKYEAVVSMSQKFTGEGDRPYSDVVQKNIQIILVPIQKPEGTYYEVKLGDISITDNNI